jgi:hypothetical protein
MYFPPYRCDERFSACLEGWWRSRCSSSLPWRSSIQPPTASILLHSDLLLVTKPYSANPVLCLFPSYRCEERFSECLKLVEEQRLFKPALALFHPASDSYKVRT